MTLADFELWLDESVRCPLVMGVLNVTPDSFSDGGRYSSPDAAVERAERLLEEGADLIDIGGESTRPGAERVSSDEQTDRVLPVVERVARLGALISVDTTSATVAERALRSGAGMVNDVSAGLDDPAMSGLVARVGCPVILMHMPAPPSTMQNNPTYADVVAEVRDYLTARVAEFVQAGTQKRRIIVDPGIGFGKTLSHNLLLLRATQTFANLGHPLLIGTSRKSFIKKVLADEKREKKSRPEKRADAGLIGASEEAADGVRWQEDMLLLGTLASSLYAAAHGAGIVRVHDVAPVKPMLTMIHAIQTGLPTTTGSATSSAPV